MDITGTTLDYEQSEIHILLRLGWAVVKQWEALPEDVRQRLRQQAVLTLDKIGPEPVQLAQTIDAFIEKHTRE
jgi:hypothetical protein